MIQKLIYILVFAVAYVLGGKCPVFSCGPVTNSIDGKKTCVSFDKKWNVNPCPKSQFCGGHKFFTVEQATDQTTCTSKPVNQRLNGDICTNDLDCFQNLKCLNKTCQAGSSTDACEDKYGRPEPRLCNKGLFCNSSKKCADAAVKNGVCDNTKPCEFGTLCAKTPSDTYYTCKELFKIPDGTKIDISKVFVMDYPSYSVEDLCQSGHIFRNSLGTYCMHAPQSVDTDNDKRKRENGSGEKCNFYGYSNPSSPTQTELLTDYSQCGFNNVDAGYCDVRKGDKEFTSVYSDYKQLISNNTSKCHISSNVFDCANSTDTTRELKSNWTKAKFITMQGNYAAVANNDDCVKSSITGAFWGYPNFSKISFNLATWASIFILIGALSILF